MTEKELLKKLGEVNDVLSSGTVITGGGSGGVNSTQQQIRNFKLVQRDIIHDLHILDPVRYSKPTRVRKTRARFC